MNNELLTISMQSILYLSFGFIKSTLLPVDFLCHETFFLPVQNMFALLESPSFPLSPPFSNLPPFLPLDKLCMQITKVFGFFPLPFPFFPHRTSGNY